MCKCGGSRGKVDVLLSGEACLSASPACVGVERFGCEGQADGAGVSRSHSTGGNVRIGREGLNVRNWLVWRVFLVMFVLNADLPLKRVERNRGAAGVDGMRADELRAWCLSHWREVRGRLDVGTYAPRPVRRVMIPKPDGGERMLGVSSVLDRLI